VVQLGSGVEGHDGFAAPDGLRLASSSYDFHVYLGHRAKNAVLFTLPVNSKSRWRGEALRPLARLPAGFAWIFSTS
jgi:hypothetical protein